jgi:triosephosphate isomerase
VRPLVGTSFKMNLTSSQAGAYFDRLRPLVASLTAIDLFVLPPFTSLWVARERLVGSNVAWGAQDVHAEDEGPHTGDVAASMLADLGCSFVEAGHSERRRDHGETDELVAAKVAQIVRHRMTAIVCVGETRRGDVASALSHVLGQVRKGLALVAPGDRHRVVVAYEPVWAIGAGAAAADPAHVSGVQGGIHDFLRSADGGGVDARVLYGGSVDETTAASLLAAHGVNGLFVGRAALEAARFAAIAEVAEAGAAAGR